MRDLAQALPLLVLLMLPGLARGDRRPGLEEALRLQAELKKAVERATPSIACILVSRSNAYRRWESAPAGDNPGKLGRFDAAAALAKVPENDARARRSIRAHDLSDPAVVPESFGTGLVLARSGLILTNAHVVRHATKVYVRFAGSRGSWADIHAADPRSDLAVLRLLDPVPGLEPVTFGDGEKVARGQFVLSLINPFTPGFRDARPRASWSMVSNLHRRAPGRPSEMDRTEVTLHHYGTLLQTESSMTIGSSGGALLNLEGEVVGILTALPAISGEEPPGGFAVPISAPLKRIIAVLQRGEEVEYGFLGVRLHPTLRPSENGVRLEGVAPGTPAQSAGLMAGDYITRVNGHPVREMEDLFLHVGIHLAGTTIRVEARRGFNGPRRTYEVKLSKFYVPGEIIASRRPPACRGLRVDYTSILSQKPGALPWGKGPPRGVMIREVQPDSPADKAHLQVEKVITQVNGEDVTTPAQFYAHMARAVGPVELTVLDAHRLPVRVTLSPR